MPILDDVTQAVGNTPLVRLNRITDGDAIVAAKLEFYNPASSVKDRIGVAIIDAAEALRRAASPAAPSSRRPRATPASRSPWSAPPAATRSCSTMPESMSKERRALLRAYGAELVLTDPRPRA